MQFIRMCNRTASGLLSGIISSHARSLTKITSGLVLVINVSVPRNKSNIGNETIVHIELTLCRVVDYSGAQLFQSLTCLYQIVNLRQPSLVIITLGD